MEYYKLTNGEYISKEKVDDAVALLQKFFNAGATLVDLCDDDIIHKGNKIDAVCAYNRKYDCGLAEAKAAIEYLRGEWNPEQ